MPTGLDIGREIGHHLSFGYGIHFASARRWRLEGRAALDEVLKRFPDWDVDWDGAKMALRRPCVAGTASSVVTG